MAIANELGIDLTPDGEAALRMMEQLENVVIEVGYQADQLAEDGETTLAEIAYWNHYGTVHKDGSVLIPARPFMDALVRQSDKLNAFTRIVLKSAEHGYMTLERALNAIGSQAVSMIQQEIVRGNFAPNAEVTVNGGWIWNEYARGGKGCAVKIPGKHSTKPLIDTGSLRQGVSFVIKTAEEEGSTT